MELYSYDGNAVARLTDRITVSGNGVDTSDSGIGYFKGNVLFTGRNPGNINVVYRYNVASGLVSKLFDAPGDTMWAGPIFYTPALNNMFFYLATNKTGYELWRYDGNACSITADLSLGAGYGAGGYGFAHNMLYYNGYVYFPGSTGVVFNHFDLYRVKDTVALSPGGITLAGWQGEAVMYPNPAGNRATLAVDLRVAQQLSVMLTDASGRICYQSGLQAYGAGRHEISLALAQLAAGSYFYSIADNTGRRLASGAFTKQ